MQVRASRDVAELPSIGKSSPRAGVTRGNGGAKKAGRRGGDRRAPSYGAHTRSSSGSGGSASLMESPAVRAKRRQRKALRKKEETRNASLASVYRTTPVSKKRLQRMAEPRFQEVRAARL